MLMIWITKYIPQKKTRRILLSLLILSLLTVTFVTFAKTDNIQASLPNALQEKLPASLPNPASNIPVENLSTPEYVIIQPSEQATFSSDTVANVAQIAVKEGSRFHTGDVLLALDCRLQQAELKKAIAQQTQAQMAAKSARKLKSYGAISEFELVKATADEAIADAEVSKLRVIVEKCVIKAPFNGSVAELMVHPNETVKQGDPLLKIVNTEKLILEMRIPSAWLAWLHIDSTFYVHVNETHQTIQANITKINPEIESVSQTVKVIGTILKPDTSLLPGMSGQAIFPENPANQAKKGAS